jgi:hypothetical protein
VTDTNAPDPAPADDPAVQLARRLLDLGVALKRTCADLDGHRQALGAYLRYDSYSRYAQSLGGLLECAAGTLDHLVRATAEVGVTLAEQARDDALKRSPPRDSGEAKS